MANYPNPPSNRIAYDLNGSVLVRQDATTLVPLTTSDQQVLNDESKNGLATESLTGGGFNMFALLLPEAFDLSSFYMMFQQNLDTWTVTDLQTSPDTTNGVDGTWTTAYASVPYDDGRNYISLEPNYRQNFQPLVVNNVTGVRFTVRKTGGAASFASTINAFHLYGRMHTPHFLVIYDPVVDQEIAASVFDWGDIPQSSNDTRTFRVHNASALSAQGIILSFNDLTPGTPDQKTWHYLSKDGVNYNPTIAIGNLASGSTSGTLYVERVTPANAQLGLMAIRLVATATFI